MDQFNLEFATHWDELVGWEKRAAVDLEFLQKIISKHNCRSALDVSLGTGFHSINLIKAGMRVTSVDVSPAMIEVAKSNAQQNGVELDVLCSDWVNLTENISERFDCILCLGNSLACELDQEKRAKSVLEWSQLLKDDGVVILDRRNYEAMLAGQYGLSSRTNYFGESVSIVSNKISKEETVFSYNFSNGQSFQLKMFPIQDNEVLSIFEAANLKLEERFGDREVNRVDSQVGLYHYVFKKVSNA